MGSLRRLRLVAFDVTVMFPGKKRPLVYCAFFSSVSRFSPSYSRVVGRSHEFAFTVRHDLSVTIVVGVGSSLLTRTLRWRLRSHTTPSQMGMRHWVFTWWLPVAFVSFCFDFLLCFLGFLGLGSSSASDDILESKSLLLLRCVGDILQHN